VIFTKFGRKVADGIIKEPLDFGGNLDHITLGHGRFRVMVRWGITILHIEGYVTGICLTIL